MEYKGKGVGYALDEAIEHEMAVVERATAIKLRTEHHLEGQIGSKVPEAYNSNIEYHKQLAKWLKELKRMRKKYGSKDND